MLALHRCKYCFGVVFMYTLSDEFYLSPPSAQSTADALLKLRNSCPMVRVFSIGKSLLARQITAAAVGNVRQNHAVLFAAGFHGQEWLTTLLLIRFLDELSQHINDSNDFFGVCVKKALSQSGLVVVPLVNPDGVEIAVNGAQAAGKYSENVEKMLAKFGGKWQANAAGIDINHNFNAGFSKLKKIERENGIDSPRPGKYGGERAHSEPETRALVKLCSSFWFKRAFAFHSQGEEIFYSYGEHTPAQSLLLCRMLCALCGYSPAVADGTAAHGGFKDYFINFYHRPGFTVEIGKGENPLPIEDLEPIYSRLCEMMLTAVIV